MIDTGSRTKLPLMLLVFMLMLAAHKCQSTKPAPKCSPNPYYKILPMIANESAILNLDNLFDGYNLTFSLQGHNEWAKYITLTDKMRMLKKQIPDTPLIGLKTYHLERIGNAWGTSFVAMQERGDRTYLSYGFLSANTSAPVINNEVRVENLTNTTCFDAVIFPKADLLIVDCTVKRTQPDEYGFSYINEFHLVRISDHSLNGIIRNQMFIPFKNISRRKLQLYTQKLSGNTYMLRSYMHDGVDQANVDNTYVDVFMVNNPRDPWIVSVIDRSFLGMSTLRVSDIRVYLSEIYVLDYNKGLHRVRINTEEDLVYNGFYETKGFHRFAVYSNNLDDRFELALARGHEVIQIDWSHIDDPILLNKYSLMPDSDVKQVYINQRFVVVLSSTVNSTDKSIYNYTWVLSRGDRTYTKAFLTIKHDTPNTLVDLNTDFSYLIIIDEEKIVNYAIDEAFMVMTLKKDEDFIDRRMNFTIVANSVEATSQKNLSCSFQFNFTLLEDNNRTMWAVGDAPASYYNANYPGKVVIPIHQYALGPNITYSITETKKGQLKKYKVYQQDQLRITWDQTLPLKDIAFLRTETINRQNQDILLLFTQNKQNTTYVSLCRPNHQEIDLICNKTGTLDTDGQLNNWATSLFLSRYTMRYHHVAAYTTTKHYNKVIVDDVSATERIIQLDMGKGYEGNVTNVQMYGKYMFVTKRYYKVILIYDLELLVDDIDDTICTITHKKMYDMGVKYFSPESIETTEFYPNVLFIKTSDTIIVLDMNRECVPKLLAVLRPVQNTMIEFSFAITRSHLVVTALPNTIVEYDLSRVYLGDIKMTKKYPMYGYKLPRNYDTDVSEFSNCMYITTVSEGGDYQVFIYRAGYPAVASLYDVIDLYTYQAILVDASGMQIDYVTVYSGSELRIFREYETPIAEIINPDRSYKFYIEYYNIAASTQLQLITVSILNLPTLIAVNPRLNNIMETKDLLYSDENRISEINDTDWYDGNVLTIKSDCRDCEDLVTVKNHIHYEQSIELMPGLVDYDWNWEGGVMQVSDAIIGMDNDGNVRDFVHLPQVSNSFCVSNTAPFHSHFEVSACLEGSGVTMYMVSMLSHKGFAFSPYSSKAKELLKIEAAHQLLMLVDSSRNPFAKTRPGGVILYALNFDLDEDEAFEQIEYIDYTDFTKSDKPSYVANADLSYHASTQTYRLYITELTSGIYEITFKYISYIKGISILQVNYLNLPAKLNQLSMNPPYDATYQAVKVIQSRYDSSLLRSTDTIVVTMGVYHSMLVEATYGSNHVLTNQTIKITKFFLRYAYYTVADEVRHNNGLIVVKQTLPEDYEQLGKVKSKQIISVYDIRGVPITVPSNKVPELGLIGAHMIMDRQPRAFDFNLTYNRSDPHAEPRVNMVVVHEFSNKVEQLSLHRNLSVFTKQKVDTQIIYLDLINDFDIKKIRILLNGYSPFPQWLLITIILFSIIGFFIFLGLSYVTFKKIMAYRAMKAGQVAEQPEPRTSLLTEQKTDRYSYSQPADRYSSSYESRTLDRSRDRYTQEREERFGTGDRERERERQLSREREKERQKEKERQRQRERERERERQREREREREQREEREERQKSNKKRANRFTDNYSGAIYS